MKNDKLHVRESLFLHLSFLIGHLSLIICEDILRVSAVTFGVQALACSEGELCGRLKAEFQTLSVFIGGSRLSLENSFQDFFVALEYFQIGLAVASRNDINVRLLRRVPARSDKKGRCSRRRTIDPGRAMKVYASGFRSYGRFHLRHAQRQLYGEGCPVKVRRGNTPVFDSGSPARSENITQRNSTGCEVVVRLEADNARGADVFQMPHVLGADESPDAEPPGDNLIVIEQHAFTLPHAVGSLLGWTFTAKDFSLVAAGLLRNTKPKILCGRKGFFFAKSSRSWRSSRLRGESWAGLSPRRREAREENANDSIRRIREAPCPTARSFEKNTLLSL